MRCRGAVNQPVRKAGHRSHYLSHGLAHLHAHDGTLHHQGERLCNLRTVGRHRQQARQQRRHVALVALCNLQHLGHGASQLAHAVDEGAAAKVLAAQPFRQGRRQGPRAVRACGQRVRMPLQCVGKPGHPAGVPVLQVRGDQVVLAREMPVEGHLRHAGLRDHAVDARGTDAVPIEQRMGRVQQAVSGGQVLPSRGRGSKVIRSL